MTNQILDDNSKVLSAVDPGLSRRFIFQHENDHNHSSKLVSAWLKRKNINVLSWNEIENF